MIDALRVSTSCRVPSFQVEGICNGIIGIPTCLQHIISHFLTSFHCKHGTTFGSHAFPFVSFSMCAYGLLSIVGILHNLSISFPFQCTGLHCSRHLYSTYVLPFRCNQYTLHHSPSHSLSLAWYPSPIVSLYINFTPLLSLPNSQHTLTYFQLYPFPNFSIFPLYPPPYFPLSLTLPLPKPFHIIFHYILPLIFPYL